MLADSTIHHGIAIESTIQVLPSAACSWSLPYCHKKPYTATIIQQNIVSLDVEQWLGVAAANDEHIVISHEVQLVINNNSDFSEHHSCKDKTGQENCVLHRRVKTQLGRAAQQQSANMLRRSREEVRKLRSLPPPSCSTRASGH